MFFGCFSNNNGIRESAEGDHIIIASAPLILENVLLCDMEYALVDALAGEQKKGHLARGDQVNITFCSAFQHSPVR